MAAARPSARGSGLRWFQCCVNRNTASLCVAMNSFLPAKTGSGGGGDDGAAGAPGCGEGTTDCGREGVGGIGADAPVPGPLTLAGLVPAPAALPPPPARPAPA